MRKTSGLLLLAAAFLSGAGCATAPSISGRAASAGALAASAEAQVGVGYRFGGNSREKGFDCSGLAWWAHAAHGIRIPRVSFEQYRAGRMVSRRALSAGDLLFFSTYKPGASHVGIYLKDGRFVHAPGTGKKVRINSLAEPYWKKRYLGARRYH